MSRRGGGSTGVAGSLEVVDDGKRGAGDLSPERSILLRCTSRPDPRALHPRAHDAAHGIYRAWRKVADGYEGERTFVVEAYRIAEHVRRLDALPESLDLHDAPVVPRDWGGPIGLSWAVAHPDRVGRLFILHTSAHRPRGRVALPLPLRRFRTPGVGEVMVKGLGLFHRVFLFRVGVRHRERLTPEVKRAYLAPHPTWSTRTGVLVFPREIPSGPSGAVAELAGALERRRETHFRDRPVQIVWAMKDPAFTPQVLEQPWLKTFPDATVIRLEDAGHYLQEDADARIVPELLAFLAAGE